MHQRTSGIVVIVALSDVQGSVEHCVIGVQILYHLVMEMNLTESMRTLSKHRKVASSFRDESLYDIFTLSCTLLQQINVHDDTQVKQHYSSVFATQFVFYCIGSKVNFFTFAMYIHT